LETYNVHCIGRKIGDDVTLLSENDIIGKEDMLIFAGNNEDLEKLAHQ
jgi:hypothetical protein